MKRVSIVFTAAIILLGITTIAQAQRDICVTVGADFTTVFLSVKPNYMCSAKDSRTGECVAYVYTDQEWVNKYFTDAARKVYSVYDKRQDLKQQKTRLPDRTGDVVIKKAVQIQ